MPTPDTRFHALVPCAGKGDRAGGPLAKQYVPLAGRPLVSHTLQALGRVRRLAQTLVVLAPDDERFEALVELPPTRRFHAARCGGPTRSASVAAGLAELARLGAAADDWVLVHDAARCLVRPEWIDALIDACRDDEVGGLLAVPVADTLKAEAGGRVASTVPRERLWQAQTPQMFRLAALQDALARFGAQATDEAGAVEASGGRPRLVIGAAENIKVTHPGDFALAEAVLLARAQ